MLIGFFFCRALSLFLFLKRSRMQRVARESATLTHLSLSLFVRPSFICLSLTLTHALFLSLLSLSVLCSLPSASVSQLRYGDSEQRKILSGVSFQKRDNLNRLSDLKKYLIGMKWLISGNSWSQSPKFDPPRCLKKEHQLRILIGWVLAWSLSFYYYSY